LDLPEPWLAVPYAAYCLKPNPRVATYSPRVEQTQKTVRALKECGFHSVQTFKYRLQEHYVDQVEYEPPPTESRPIANDPRTVPATSPASGGGATSDKETEASKGELEKRDDAKHLIILDGVLV
jgi:hypothetical protein